MSKFEGFGAADLTTITRVYKRSRLALERAVPDFDSANFRTKFKQYFGTAGGLSAVKQGEANLKSIVRAMCARVATNAFTVTYDGALAANAEMLHPHRTGVLAGNPSVGDVLSETDQLRTTHQINIPMKVGPAMMGMPFATLNVQSQVETFLHELSHHAAMTLDDKVGGECYENVGVQRLKALGPARSVFNAENVGFFLVEYAQAP